MIFRSLAVLSAASLHAAGIGCGDPYGTNTPYNITGGWTKGDGTGISSVVTFDLVGSSDGGIAGNGAEPNGTPRTFTISGVRQGRSVTLNLGLATQTQFKGQMTTADSLVLGGPQPTDSVTMRRTS